MTTTKQALDTALAPPGDISRAQSTVSVIICAYTELRWSQLCNAVASSLAQTHQGDEVILVVDHNDGLLARATSFFKEVIVTENTEVKGASGGRNTGARTAKGDILVFLDDDAAAEANWLNCLVRWYGDRGIVSVGGAARPNWEGNVRPHWLPASFDWVVGCTFAGQPTSAAVVRNIWACNMSVRHEAFRAVGGFRVAIGGVQEGVTQGCEETELCIRLGQLGQVVYDPESTVEHSVPIARQSRSYFWRRCRNEGKSKWVVAQSVGHIAATTTERGYAVQVLRESLRDFRRTMTRCDADCLDQALMSLSGLGTVAFSYGASWLRSHFLGWTRHQRSRYL